MTQVRVGVGPHLSVYLEGAEHWHPGAIGLVMAAAPLAAACLLIVLHPHFATAVIPPAIAATSLGLVGRARLDARISRNEGFNHGGNFAAAILAGGLGTWVGTASIFYLVCAFAAASALAVLLVRPNEIDHDLARGGEDPAQHCKAAPLRNHPGSGTAALSACIVAVQLVMVAVAWAVGQAAARGVGRKPIFLVADLVLPVRGLLFSITSGPYAVVAIQLLDGLASGIFGVVSVLIAADLMRGTGRFDLAQGQVALAVGIGATISNATAEFVVPGFGDPVRFLYLAAIAVCARCFFVAFMPETRPTTGPEIRSA